MCHLRPALRQGTLWGERARRRRPQGATAFHWLQVPWATSHFPDIMGAQVTMLSWWSPRAPESLPKQRRAAAIRAQRRCWGSRNHLWLQAVPFPPPGYSLGGKVRPSNPASASAQGKPQEVLTELHITGGVEACFALCFESLTEPVSPARAVSPPEKTSCNLFLHSYQHHLRAWKSFLRQLCLTRPVEPGQGLPWSSRELPDNRAAWVIIYHISA